MAFETIVVTIMTPMKLIIVVLIDENGFKDECDGTNLKRGERIGVKQ